MPTVENLGSLVLSNFKHILPVAAPPNSLLSKGTSRAFLSSIPPRTMLNELLTQPRVSHTVFKPEAWRCLVPSNEPCPFCFKHDCDHSCTRFVIGNQTSRLRANADCIAQTRFCSSRDNLIRPGNFRPPGNLFLGRIRSMSYRHPT